MPKALPAQDYLIEVFSYNPQTGTLVWKHRPASHFSSDFQFRRWNSRYAGTPALASRNQEGYLTGALDGIAYQAHRIIWKLVTGQDPAYVDHIDGERSNNAWSNLRNVTQRSNALNQKRPQNNSSGVIGVYYKPRFRTWIARICVNRKQVNLGSFSGFEEAVAARKAAEVLYGFHTNHGR
jgi:hypothetical protein